MSETQCATDTSAIAQRGFSARNPSYRLAKPFDQLSNPSAMQVKYKEVMKQYNLGPNGGILTSLNLFATRFDQVCETFCWRLCAV